MQGIRISVDWQKGELEDTVPTDYVNISIPTNNQNKDLKYIAKTEGVGANDNFRFVDAAGQLFYHFNLNEFPDATMGLDLTNNYLVSVSPDGQNWQVLFNSQEMFGRDVQDGSNRAKQFFNPKAYASAGGDLYIRLEDGSRNDGWGALVYSIEMNYKAPLAALRVESLTGKLVMERNSTRQFYLGVTNQSSTGKTVTIEKEGIGALRDFLTIMPGADEQESQYLIDSTGTGIALGYFRYADGNSYLVYKLPVPAGAENAKVKLDLQNQFEVSLSSDGQNWTVAGKEETHVTDGNNRGIREYDLSGYVNTSNQVYIRVGDSFKEDGWGGIVNKIVLSGWQPAPIKFELSDSQLTLSPHETKLVSVSVETGAELALGSISQVLKLSMGDIVQTFTVPIEIVSPRPVYHSAQAVTPIQIDGQLGQGEWENAADIIIAPGAVDVKDHGTVWGNEADSSDLTSHYRIKWDQNYFYVLEQRSDDSLNFTETGAQMYFSDATMLFLDLLGNNDGLNYRDGDYAISFTAGGPDGEPHAYLRQGSNAGLKEYALTEAIMQSTIQPGYSVMEIAIPWSALAPRHQIM